jgi:threonine aldolase
MSSPASVVVNGDAYVAGRNGREITRTGAACGDRPIELRSDTFTRPTLAMRRAMAGAVVGDDVYGEDPTVRRLEEHAAQLLGKEEGCFMPSGTMGNLTSILAWTPRGGRVLVGDSSDVYFYEAGGASVLGGAVYGPLPNQLDGSILPEDLERQFLDEDDPQFAPVSLICLENTQCKCGGVVLPLDYQRDVRILARAHGIAVHLDGARIFNAAVAMGRPAAELAQYADTVQFCLSKGLRAPIGSMVVGPRDALVRVRRLRKMLGGGMRQAGVIAAAGLVGLTEMVDRLADDHVNAARLAAGLAQLPGLDVRPPTTNIVIFDIVDGRFDRPGLIRAAGEAGVAIGLIGTDWIRAVTYADIGPHDVDRAVEIIGRVLRGSDPQPWSVAAGASSRPLAAA